MQDLEPGQASELRASSLAQAILRAKRVRSPQAQRERLQRPPSVRRSLSRPRRALPRTCRETMSPVPWGSSLAPDAAEVIAHPLFLVLGNFLFFHRFLCRLLILGQQL